MLLVVGCISMIPMTVFAADEAQQCSVLPDMGLCREPSLRYFYDVSDNTCFSALWTHCDPQQETFTSQRRCEQQCIVAEKTALSTANVTKRLPIDR